MSFRLPQDWYDIAARAKRAATKSGTGCRTQGATSDAVESGNLSALGVSSLNCSAGHAIGGAFFGEGDAA